MGVPVRLSPDWWSVADDRILEFLDLEGPHTPKRIADSGIVKFSRQHVNMRLGVLNETGFVEKDVIGRGVYQITEQGEEYLRGEFDAQDLHKPDS